MSPLGTLVALTNNNNNSGSSAASVKNSYYGINDPLLRLMSLSLVNDPGSSALAVLNNFNSFTSNLQCHSAVAAATAAAAAAAAAAAMQFSKSGVALAEPVSPPISVLVPSSSSSPSRMTTSSSLGHPDSPPALTSVSSPVLKEGVTTTMGRMMTNTAREDEDEVLSIGREDDEQMVIDCDSSTLSDDNMDDKDCHSDRTECLELEEERVNSPSSPSDSSSNSRRRHSSDEYAKMKNDAALQRHHHHHHHPSVTSRESLMFSIANILRPDFGVAGQAPPIPPQPRHNTSTNHYNHHLLKLNQAAALLPSSRKSHHHHNHHHKGQAVPLTTLPTKIRRSEHHIPIDLSRPASNDSSAVSPNHRRKSSSHHHPTENRKPNSNNGNGVSSPAKKSSSSDTANVMSPDSDHGSSRSRKDDSDSKSESNLWPAWVYCTRYSDRPSSGPRSRRTRKPKDKEVDEKRPRTAFTADQLSRLKKEFDENRYLTEKRRQDLARELRLHENQIKIWFQNKRAKLKKSTGQRGNLALQLMAQGLYNHSTIPPKGELDGEEDSD